jgi:hypothetical protein
MPGRNKKTVTGPKCKYTVGSLVEHRDYVGYRGIVRKVIKTRGPHLAARVVSVSWFPPISTAEPMHSWQQEEVTGTTDESTLKLDSISALPPPK